METTKKLRFTYPLTLVKGNKYYKVAQKDPAGGLSIVAFVNREGGQSYLASGWKQINKRRPISKEYALDLTATALDDMNETEKSQ